MLFIDKKIVIIDSGTSDPDLYNSSLNKHLANYLEDYYDLLVITKELALQFQDVVQLREYEIDYLIRSKLIIERDPDLRLPRNYKLEILILDVKKNENFWQKKFIDKFTNPSTGTVFLELRNLAKEISSPIGSEIVLHRNEDNKIGLIQASRIRNISILVSLLFLLIIIGVTVQWRTIVLNRNAIQEAHSRIESLLLNILPAEIAKELEKNGYVKPQDYSLTTVLFTDFKEFTKFSEKSDAKDIVKLLDYYFTAFDGIVEKFKLEKIKTIGDSYMCAGGLPSPNKTNPEDVVKAAFEILSFVDKSRPDLMEKKITPLEVRIGIHTGPLVAGVVGVKKFQYDIWGNTVNVASRIESISEVGKIGLSETTYFKVKDKFNCTYRGEVQLKHIGKMNMYYADSLLTS